ncbi:MAG TPA: FecR family protein [Bdellovibrionales bacterium]|nr:FecR family protein [Bdellovibrionales bacterium]
MNKFFGVLIAFIVSSFAYSQAEAACGKFEVSKGDVKVERAGALSPAPQGSPICSGDAVVSGPEGRAKIVMEDGNVLNISPSSKIVLEKYEFNAADNKKKVLLNVLKGKVRAATAKEEMYNDKAKDGQANTFQVKTKSAVAGVRGTDFLTGFDPKTNRAEIVTFKGKVDVGQLGPGGRVMNVVSVTAGQKTVAEFGKPPAPPVSVPKAELDGANKETGGNDRGPSSERRGRGDSMVGDGEKTGEAKSDGQQTPSDNRGPANDGQTLGPAPKDQPKPEPQPNPMLTLMPTPPPTPVPPPLPPTPPPGPGKLKVNIKY